MRKARALLDFIALPVPHKIIFYRNVLTKLTGNASFPTPDKPLADGKPLVDTFEKWKMSSEDGSHTANASMHAAELLADDYFRNMAAYVTRIANGDEAKILSSGFNVSKTAVATYNKPDLEAIDGAVSGTVLLRCKAIKDARSYIWYFSKDAAPTTGTWPIAGYSANTTFEVANLISASKYVFKVAAITPSGVTPAVGPITKVVA